MSTSGTTTSSAVIKSAFLLKKPDPMRYPLTALNHIQPNILNITYLSAGFQYIYSTNRTFFLHECEKKELPSTEDPSLQLSFTAEKLQHRLRLHVGLITRNYPKPHPVCKVSVILRFHYSSYNT